MKRKKRKREQKKQDTNVGVLKYLWSIMMKTISIKKQINNDENNLDKKKSIWIYHKKGPSTSWGHRAG